MKLKEIEMRLEVFGSGKKKIAYLESAQWDLDPGSTLDPSGLTGC